MGLRDILVLVLIYGSIPFILRKPFIGVLVWFWLGLMNPHRITWTLANQPFAQIIILVLFVSLLLARREAKYIPANPITVTLGIFWAWMLLTTLTALYPIDAWHQWDKVWKIMLTTYVGIMILSSKERVLALTFVAAFSIAFYGIKGGFFTFVAGGGERVWGPPGTFIGGNNEIGLALIMTVPLLFFFRNFFAEKWIKHLMLVSIILCVFSILGTQSRGAFIGVAAMGLFLAMKSNNKAGYILLVLMLVPVALMFMPQDWHDRMATILDYQSDGSAMGRLKAWEMAFYLALDRLTGGGFETFRPGTYLAYLPEVGPRNTDAHSIYFETMAEHGFIGLGLFLLLGIFALRECGRIIRATKTDPKLRWMRDLAAMMQVSLIGYAVSGAFLGLAYFNYYYCLLAIVVGMTVTLKKTQSEAKDPVTTPAIVGARVTDPSGAGARAAAGAAQPKTLAAGGGWRKYYEKGKVLWAAL